MTAQDVGSEVHSPLPVGVERETAPSDPTLVPATRSTLEEVARQVDRYADEGNIEALGAGLARLREFRQSVHDIERQIEDYVAGLMDQDMVNVADWLTLERSRPSMRRTKWQSKALLFELIGGTRLVNPETGEDVTDLLLECVPFTASLSWRTGALRERGIQVDEWCDESPARRTVKATLLELEAGDD